jgi:importin subunit beta-1
LQIPQYEGYWIQLDVEFKSNIKVAILATLASPKGLVRGQVAQIIAAIATLELPRKEWDDLLPSLCGNATSQELNIRLASLTTIGYICDELHPDDIPGALKA